MKVDEVPGELDSDPLVVPFRQNSPNVGPIPSPYYMNKTTTSPHSCTSHRRAAAHRRAGGKRALRLLIFRFWVDFEEIYLYFVPCGAPRPGSRLPPSRWVTRQLSTLGPHTGYGPRHGLGHGTTQTETSDVRLY